MQAGVSGVGDVGGWGWSAVEEEVCPMSRSSVHRTGRRVTCLPERRIGDNAKDSDP